MNVASFACSSSDDQDEVDELRQEIERLQTQLAQASGRNAATPGSSTVLTSPTVTATATRNTPTATATVNGVKTVNIDRGMEIIDIDPEAPLQGIEIRLLRLEVSTTQTRLVGSVWNRNQQKTAFENLWRWRGTNSESEPPYIVDSNGTKYVGSRPDRVAPVPGERQEFAVLFKPLSAGTTSVELHLQADVRACILGFCDYPIRWQSITIEIPR